MISNFFNKMHCKTQMNYFNDLQEQYKKACGQKNKKEQCAMLLDEIKRVEEYIQKTCGDRAAESDALMRMGR